MAKIWVVVRGEKLATVRTVEVMKIDTPRALLTLAFEHRKKGGMVVLEVACGGKFSLNLGRNCLDIGVDPDAECTDTNGLVDGRGARRVFFAEKSDVLPAGLNPDAVVIVAPCPDEVEMILVGLESAILRGKTQFLIMLEDESFEVEDGKAEKAKFFARRWLQRMGLSVCVDDEVSDDPDYEDLACSFNLLLQVIGLDSGVLKSAKFGRESRWIAVMGCRL